VVNFRQLIGKLRGSADRRVRICAAINSRRCIEFVYHDNFRGVEPFCLGVITPSPQVDNEALLGYQVRGYDELGEVTGWKLFRLADISDLHIINEPFTTANHEPNLYQVTMSPVYCCITPDDADGVRLEEKAPVREPGVAVSRTYTPEVKQGSPLTHNELMRRFRFSHQAIVSRVAKRVADIGCAIRKRL